jgi:sigma-B regulation protein RsbU (phosphoserine phosphatase)
VSPKESTFQLSPNDQLTLMTNGVLEARNSVGELFCFERTASISKGAAEEIASAAQSIGQEDDMTVLTVATAFPPVPLLSQS